ncbi:MAG: radical SAM protein [Candidatus Diapherotrites archaeon]
MYNITGGSGKPPLLKHYMVGPEIEKTIQHNVNWAKGKEKQPIFKFAYLMLPTSCNQKCLGCFTGKDKGKLPKELNGPFYSKETLDSIISFLKEHSAETIVYGGGGELFTWNGAKKYIQHIIESGLGIVIFTNGTLLDEKTVKWLSELDVSLIISIRDINEREHNRLVGIKGYKKTMHTLNLAIKYGMQKDNRLAVEIPVTNLNQNRVLDEFIPQMRSLGVIPFVEEFIQITTNKKEQKICHNFKQSREFFEKARKLDRSLGFEWKNQFGQRVIAQPMCKRPLYSFAVYPNGDVMDCPSHSVNYGNIYKNPNGIRGIIYSQVFKDALLNFSLCACSVFYTNNVAKLSSLPSYLEVFKDEKA